MSPDRPRVLYIAGMTRCGSTLLGNVLGEVPGVLHLGELHYLWLNGLLGSGTNSTCGCGQELRACPVWSRVLANPAVRGDEDGARAVVAAQDRHLDHGRTPARVAELTSGRRPAGSTTTATDAMAAAYRELVADGETGLLVDGSKYPAEAAALAARDDLDVRVLHMVRDARATAHSYRRAKSYIERMSGLEAAQRWSRVNAAADRVGEALGPERYLRIHHEDLGADPVGVVGEVLRFAGVEGSPVDPDGTVELRGNHTVTGNPDRLERGRVPVRAGERWIEELPTGVRALVTLAAAPGLHRYGYLAGASRAPRPATTVGRT